MFLVENTWIQELLFHVSNGLDTVFQQCSLNGNLAYIILVKVEITQNIITVFMSSFHIYTNTHTHIYLYICIYTEEGEFLPHLPSDYCLKAQVRDTNKLKHYYYDI